MAKTKQIPTPASSGRHPHDITIERQPDESAEAWEALIRNLEESPTVTVTRLDDNSIGLRRDPVRAAA